MHQLLKFKIAFSVLALFFIGTMFFQPYPGSFIIKALPIFLMAFLSYKHLKGSLRYLMVFGFLFSAGGDIFLDLSRTAYFIQGLASFAIAHLMYTIVFGLKMKLSRFRVIIAALMVLYMGSIIFILFPYLGDMVAPVLVYILLISAMGITAAFTDRKLNTVFIGALFFILSDSIIALTKFVYPLPYAVFLIIPTYYLAQYKIGMGMIEEEHRKQNNKLNS